MKWFLTTLVMLFIVNVAEAAITLTGDVDADFAVANCLEDEGGQDVGVPAGVAATGFDIERACFYYDGSADELHVGVTTFNDVIFGDADGDGDPGASSTSGVNDPADLGVGESLVIAFDLDGDSEDLGFDVGTVDMLVGVSNSGSYDDIGGYAPSTGYDPSNNPDLGFASQQVAAVSLFASPSTSVRDLEFTILNFRLISANGIETIINKLFVQIFTGSSVAPGIGDDYLPTIGEAQQHAIFDVDEDDLEDWEEVAVHNTNPYDADSDDDGVDDGTEVNGANPTDPNDNDSDNDTCTDGTEDGNANGTHEPDSGETDPNNADTDSDGINDCTELNGENPTDANDDDSDDDGLIDGAEDTNANGAVDEGETDPNNPDTDFGGVNDGDEVANGFNPLDPSDDGTAAEQVASAANSNRVQGGGLGCSLSMHAQARKNFMALFGVVMGFSLLSWRASRTLNKIQ